MDVLVATPGRLLDHMRNTYARLTASIPRPRRGRPHARHGISARHPPDPGCLPVKRQTLLFSATLPPPIVRLGREMLESPSPSTSNETDAAAGITHVAYPVPHELKSALLLELLKQTTTKACSPSPGPTSGQSARRFPRKARGGLCPDPRQSEPGQRTQALSGFKRGKFRVLVATDIAARGIDVEALGLVCNFDVPPFAEDYVHRVGRTGRATPQGTRTSSPPRRKERSGPSSIPSASACPVRSCRGLIMRRRPWNGSRSHLPTGWPPYGPGELGTGPAEMKKRNENLIPKPDNTLLNPECRSSGTAPIPGLPPEAHRTKRESGLLKHKAAPFRWPPPEGRPK